MSSKKLITLSLLCMSNVILDTKPTMIPTSLMNTTKSLMNTSTSTKSLMNTTSNPLLDGPYCWPCKDVNNCIDIIPGYNCTGPYTERQKITLNPPCWPCYQRGGICIDKKSNNQCSNVKPLVRHPTTRMTLRMASTKPTSGAVTIHALHCIYTLVIYFF